MLMHLSMQMWALTQSLKVRKRLLISLTPASAAVALDLVLPVHAARGAVVTEHLSVRELVVEQPRVCVVQLPEAVKLRRQ